MLLENNNAEWKWGQYCTLVLLTFPVRDSPVRRLTHLAQPGLRAVPEVGFGSQKGQ